MEFFIKLFTVFCLYLVIRPIIETFKILGKLLELIFTIKFHTNKKSKNNK